MRETPKLAQRIAHRIERDILHGALPVGHRLGTEAELIAQYEVSRAVLREAIRMVERHGLGETRRGIGGGLFVSQPARQVVARLLSGYLEAAGLGIAELFEARRLIEAVTLRYATERIDSAGIAELKKLVTPRETPVSKEKDIAEHERFHTLIAEQAQSPALALFVQALHKVTQDVGLSLRIASSSEAGWQAKRRIVMALEGTDTLEAQRLMNDLLLTTEASFRQGETPALPARRGEKRAEGLAREFTDEIRRGDWARGFRIGSEPELIEKHRVSRAVFREAVRMLEQYGVAEMRRGSGGGLFVGEPDPSIVVVSASAYLSRLGLSSQSRYEARAAIEPAAASLAAERASDHELDELMRALKRELACPDDQLRFTARAVHEQIVDLSGNPAIALYARVLSTSDWGDAMAPTPQLPPAWQSDLRESHALIVGAIRGREPRKAASWMNEHIGLTTRWWASVHAEGSPAS